MSRISYFQGMLASVFEQGKIFRSNGDKRNVMDLCNALMSEQGEVSGTKIAASALAKYELLKPDQKVEFFSSLAEEFDVDPDAVVEAAQNYAQDRTPETLHRLNSASEPKRQELFRRLNQVPGATEKLVHMREDIFPLIREHPELALVDAGFERLFSTWFNRGFLVLNPIDWRTPANILEKIIAYEAVHAINDWDDLRRRLQPADRRCFAFFHPVMAEEPLIFVEVALTKGMPDSIEALLAEDREALGDDEIDTAVFYSISNCQAGLRGVSFGNFLIKQVANDLAQSLPRLKNFVTLSPVPGFAKWLANRDGEDTSLDIERTLTILSNERHDVRVAELEELEKPLVGLMAHYLVNAKRPNGMPVDPVSRFHLGNGASLARINWMADKSANGIGQSAGMMVNYKYDLATVEANHEAYVCDGEVLTTREIKGLAKG
ncbi:MAG: malonyl-CoA decarboxylase [Pseudomonadota bacterium]